MRTRLAHLAVAAPLAVGALAGCGGGNASSRPPNGEALKSPTQIVADTAAALDHVRSFHLAGTGTDLRGGRQTVIGDFGIPGRLHLVLAQAGGSVEIILVGGSGYFKASRAFWIAQGTPPSAAALLADRWVKLAATAPGISEFVAWTNPATIGHCLVGKDLGTLSVAGHDTVAGQPVVVVADHGDLAGSTPERLYVTTTGPPLPLRVVQTGPQRSGGTPDRLCNETRRSPSTTQSGDLRISRYNEPVSITAPSGALDLSAVTGQ
jgi:hypothetical protein